MSYISTWTSGQLLDLEDVFHLSATALDIKDLMSPTFGIGDRPVLLTTTFTYTNSMGSLTTSKSLLTRYTMG